MDRGKEVFLRVVSEVSEEVGIIRRSFLSNLSEQQITNLYHLIIDHLIKSKEKSES